jgi:hypothetical protein
MTKSTIVFAGGSGRFEQMSLYLARSVDERTNHDIIIFVPTDEYSELDEETILELEERCTTVAKGAVTIPEYPQSAKLDALISATNHTSPPYVLLDTDTLVCQSLDGICEGNEIAAKPVDIGQQYWGQSDSLAEWRSLYKERGIPLPDQRTTATVDGVETFPYYNAGVVATTSQDVPERWLTLTKSVYHDISEPYFADQIGLAMLMTDLESKELTEMDNYPCPLRIRFPSTIRILHYHSNYILRRVWYSKYRDLLQSVGVDQTIQDDSFIDRLSTIGGSLYHMANGRFMGI